MDVRRAERLLPVRRAALADVAELGCACRHPLPKLGREAVERVLRDAERLEALIRERRGDPGAVCRVLRGLARVDEPVQTPHQLPPRRTVVDPQEEVGADVGSRPLVQRAALDVVELQAVALHHGHG